MNLHDISSKYAGKVVEIRDTSKVYVDGKRLDILEFETNPSYRTWYHGDYHYKLAVHEKIYSRGGADDCVDDVGVELLVIIDGQRFNVSSWCETILSCEPPEMEFECHAPEDLFNSEEEKENFEEMMKEYIEDTYDFTKHYE